MRKEGLTESVDDQASLGTWVSGFSEGDNILPNLGRVIIGRNSRDYPYFLLH